MSIIAKYQKELKKLQGQLPVMAREIVKKNEGSILEIFQDEQMSQGLKRGARNGGAQDRGIALGYYSSELTQQAWRQYWFPSEPPTDKALGHRVDLYWSGDFYSGMYIVFVGKFDFVINSSDKKTPVLVKKYGNIFNLTGKTLRSVENKIVEPVFSAEFNKRFSAIV